MDDRKQDQIQQNQAQQYVTQAAIQFVRCDIQGCFAYFTSYQEMNKHKVVHANHLVARAAHCIPFTQAPQREGNHRCDICGKSLSSRRCLREHIQRHSGDKPFVCDIAGCGKRFVNDQSLADHRATHFDDRPFRCDFKLETDGRTITCGKSFKNNGQLRGHRLAVHKPPSMKCQFYGCEYSARRSRHMQVHISKKHSEQLNNLGSILQVMPNTSQTEWAKNCNNDWTWMYNMTWQYNKIQAVMLQVSLEWNFLYCVENAKATGLLEPTDWLSRLTTLWESIYV